ncbi:hypothetical protein ACFL6Y_08240 [Elusimicrobiota bacterium]
MEETNFDAKIAGLRKAIESNRSVWRKAFEIEEKKWQQQIEEKSEAITGLKEKIETLNAQWEEKYKDAMRELTGLKDSHADAKFKLGRSDDEIKAKSEQLESYKTELRARQSEFDKKLDEKDTSARGASVKISDLQEEVKILKGRLAEERQRWDDVVKMKEKDFEVLKTELEKKAKDWEGQYQKDEEEIQIVLDGRKKLEKKIEDLSSQMRSGELKSREQISLKEDEVASLKRELALSEDNWKDRLKRKENEVDAIRSQMEEYVREVSSYVEGKDASDEEQGRQVDQPAKPGDGDQAEAQSESVKPEAKKKWRLFGG